MVAKYYIKNICHSLFNHYLDNFYIVILFGIENHAVISLGRVFFYILSSFLRMLELPWWLRW